MLKNDDQYLRLTGTGEVKSRADWAAQILEVGYSKFWEPYPKGSHYFEPVHWDHRISTWVFYADRMVELLGLTPEPGEDDHLQDPDTGEVRQRWLWDDDARLVLVHWSARTQQWTATSQP